MEPLEWLLEPDPANPGVRYRALRDLLGRPADDPEVVRAQAAVMESGPVPAILDAQYPQGYWVKPGGGYSPKYRSTVWQIIFLAELGADPADPRVRRGCEYLLDHSIAANGGFSNRQKPVPSGVVHCLNGNLVYALTRLGYGSDPRVRAALEWQVGAVLGEGEYYRSATSGPGFACGFNGGLPCAWGAAKALKAFLAVPPSDRTEGLERAIAAASEFLLSRDPAAADYPHTGRVASAWFKLGFPLTYWSDVLEVVSLLVELGQRERVENGIRFILEKRDEAGRWRLEHGINGKMWADIEEEGRPSKWVTLRAVGLGAG